MFSQWWNIHCPNIPIRFQALTPPILSSFSSRYTIEFKKQIAVVMHLRPGQSVNQLFIAVSIDMRDTPGIPYDFDPVFVVTRTKQYAANEKNASV
jgi:hypothetical protein